MPCANSLFLWWRHPASYIHTYIHVNRCMFMDIFFFSPFALQQSWYLMLIPVATRSVVLHTNIRTLIYILYIWASSPHLLRWHHLEIHPYMFTDYRIIFSSTIIVLVPIPGPTAIEDGFGHNSVYVMRGDATTGKGSWRRAREYIYIYI